MSNITDEKTSPEASCAPPSGSEWRDFNPNDEPPISGDRYRRLDWAFWFKIEAHWNFNRKTHAWAKGVVWQEEGFIYQTKRA